MTAAILEQALDGERISDADAVELLQYVLFDGHSILLGYCPSTSASAPWCCKIPAVMWQSTPPKIWNCPLLGASTVT